MATARPPQPRRGGLAVAIVQAPVHDGNHGLPGRQDREEECCARQCIFAWGWGMVLGRRFPCPFTKGSARVRRVIPLRRPRCPVSRSRPASCCKTAKSDGRAWSLEHRRSPHVRSGAVDDRVRDVYYANRPVVAGGASSDDERGRGRAGQRQWPLDRPAVSFSLR